MRETKKDSQLRFLLILISSFYIYWGTHELLAEPLAGGLEVGMSYQDVLKSLGKPEEKLELEAKREDLWTYKEIDVRFKNGEVIASEFRKGMGSDAGAAGADTDDLFDMVGVEKPDEAVTVEQILEEIMDGSEGESSDAPAIAGVVPPVVNQ